MPLPPAVTTLLDRQFGFVGRAQLLQSMSRGEVDGFVQRRLLVPEQRGVYRAAGGVVTPAGEAMAAVLRARPDARVTGPRVLALLGVDGLPDDAPFEVLVRPGRRIRNVDFRVRTDPTPERRGATFGNGLPIVHPAAAVVDTARFADLLGHRTVKLAYDVARWRGLVTVEGVRSRCCQLGTADPGAAYFLGMDERLELTAESDGERALGQVLSVFEPAVEAQVWVLPDVRVDWFWRVVRIAFEYQGEVDHSTARDRIHDSGRSAKLESVGVLTVPVVAADLADAEGLRAWAAALATVRARELGVDPPVSRAG